MESLIKPLDQITDEKDNTVIREMVIVKVLDVAPVRTYQTRDGSDGALFEAVLADRTSTAKMLCYDTTKAITAVKDADICIINYIMRQGYVRQI